MTQRATPDRQEPRLSFFKTEKSETSDKLALGTSCWTTSTLISYIITLQVTNSTLNLLGVWMKAPRQSGDASAESWRRTRGGTGCTCLLAVSKYTRLLFPSSALIQETRFSPHSSLRLTWTSCPSFLSEPGGVGSFLLIHVLKTALIKNKMFVWFRLTAWFGGVRIFLLHFKSEVWLEVRLTLFPFLKMYFSYISALTSNSLPETFPSLISSCSLAFFFCASFKTLFFIFHQSSASPPFSFSLFILTSLSEQRWKKSLVMAKTAQAVWRRPGLTLLSHNLCLLVLLIKVAF